MLNTFRSARNSLERQFWPPTNDLYRLGLNSVGRALARSTERAVIIIRSALEISQYISRRAKIHHVYFALALFDLAAVGTGLYLNHHLNQTLAISTGINASLDSRFAEIDSFRRSVNAIVETGHNASYGKSTASEFALYSEASEESSAKLRAFLPSLLQFTRKFEPLLRSDSNAYEALAHTLTVEAIGQIAVQRAGLVLNLNARGDAAAAVALSDEMRQFHSRFLKETDTLSRTLRITGSELQSAQIAEGSNLQSLEYLIGAMMVFMVCAVTLYGHKLGKMFQLKHDELERAHDDAKQAEAETRALNKHVTDLNVELANSILQLQEAQSEIVRKGKMAQLGQLTATVAHEIRNPLGAIKSSTHLVARKVKDTDLGLEKAITRINNGITRCDNIITELLDFARAKALHLEATTLDTWVRTVVEEEARSLPPAVQLSFELGLGEARAVFDAERMRRVIINLLSNAAEAMIGKGDLKVAVVTQDPKIHVRTQLVDGNIEITVKDNGPGISEANIKKILEPLFTTKSFGVGLGLPAIEQILEQHGGGLRIESKLGEGATFTAWFPLEETKTKAA